MFYSVTFNTTISIKLSIL